MAEANVKRQDDTDENSIVDGEAPKTENFKVPDVPRARKEQQAVLGLKQVNGVKYSAADRTLVFVNATRLTWEASVSQLCNSNDEDKKALFKSMAKSVQSFLFLFFKCKKMEYPPEATNADVSMYIVDAMQYRFRDEYPVLQQIAIGIFHVVHMGRLSYRAMKKISATREFKA